ncbi:MAG: CRISPR-associated endonuclease Cas2 [Bacillota bacterium]|nr:CRISPR-associated endonuclease Cas2 [Bacillota bacterium]
MRMLLFFDLPVVESEERREYVRFRKYLIKSGFIMLQESVYCKLLLNSTAVAALAENVRKNKPPKGLIQILLITEKQYARMEYILGEFESEVIDSDERLIVL